LFTLRRALIDLGSRAIDGRSSVGGRAAKVESGLDPRLRRRGFDIDPTANFD
jgi:hypothetical protein